MDKPRVLRDGSTVGQASPETAYCPRCSGALDQHTWDGRYFDRCPRCGYYSEPRLERNPTAPVDEDPMGISDIPALPSVKPGQLRCQVCARGVDGAGRFCDRCTVAGPEALLAAEFAGEEHSPSLRTAAATTAFCETRAPAKRGRGPSGPVTNRKKPGAR